jgi:hypothetical protein
LTTALVGRDLPSFDGPFLPAAIRRPSAVTTSACLLTASRPELFALCPSGSRRSPAGLAAAFKPSQSGLVDEMAAIRGIYGGGELDVQLGGPVDLHGGIPERVVQYVTAMQSPITDEVQMEADDLDSRQVVWEAESNHRPWYVM